MIARTRPVAIHVLTRLIRGGPTRPVLATLARLGELGYRPVLVTGAPASHEDEALDALESCPDLPVLKLPFLRRELNLARDARAIGALRAACKRLRPAILHTHTSKAGGVGRLGAALSRGRFMRIHTFHGHSMTRDAAGRSAPLWRIAERLLARTATDLIVTVSPGQREDLLGRLGRHHRKRMAVVPLAFDPYAYGLSGERGVRIAEWRRPGERLLAFCGRGVRVKGLDVLARAHARLVSNDRERGERLRIVVIGPLEPMIRDEVLGTLGAAGIAQQWNFTGPVPNPLPLLEATDGLVLPSRSEGTPVSILEALEAGLPVIASAVGGVPDLLQTDWERHGPGEWSVRPTSPRGLLLPPGDVEAWAGALGRWVLDSTAVPGEPRERRQFVRRVFDADLRTADLHALYQDRNALRPPDILDAGGRQEGARRAVSREDQARPAL